MISYQTDVGKKISGTTVSPNHNVQITKPFQHITPHGHHNSKVLDYICEAGSHLKTQHPLPDVE